MNYSDTNNFNPSQLIDINNNDIRFEIYSGYDSNRLTIIAKSSFMGKSVSGVISFNDVCVSNIFDLTHKLKGQLLELIRKC
jgi:hypothetical protein